MTTRKTERLKLLVSFSGGETSAYMVWWLWTHCQHLYEMVVVFANTGEENEETLQFVKMFSAYFAIPVVWVESIVHHNQRKSNSAKVVDFDSASRHGEPYEEIIKKYGIPNRNMPHCTRELKLRPIQDYAKSALGWKKYWTAVGIRVDEMDRMNKDRDELRLIYPLTITHPMTKPQINSWWSKQPFRLNLKGYQGNCKWCWKKSKFKLLQIAKEAPWKFQFPLTMEARYGDSVSQGKRDSLKKREKEVPQGITFFRERQSAAGILKESKLWDGNIPDDAQIFDNQMEFEFENESCDVFSTCGSTKENQL